MSDHTADVAAVLAEHQINVARQSYPTYSCSCAEWDGSSGDNGSLDDGSRDTVQAARAHVAAALLASEPIAQALAAVEANARVEALAEEDAKRRRECREADDCSCSYKDCYECGKWHNCTHTPYTELRAALRPKGGKS